MIHHVRYGRWFLPMTIGGAVLLAALVLYGASAHAQGANANPEQQLNRLRQQVAALEDRVKELEKISVLTAAQEPDPQALKVKAPFEVVDARGKTLMKVEAVGGSGSLTVGDPAAGSAIIGVGRSGAGYLLANTPAGEVGVAIGRYLGAGMGVHVVAADGVAVRGSLALDSSGDGRLTVGDEESAGATLGVGKSGGGFAIVRRGDGHNGIALGQLEGKPMSVTVFGEDDNELVSLRTDSKGGAVMVMNPEGVGVGGLLAGDGGGRVALTGAAGGKSAVSLSVEATGGKVRVFPPGGGSAQAELTAESVGGAFTAYNSSGRPIAFFGSKDSKGYLELNDSGGSRMIEAGSLPEHKGYVLASPYETRGGVLGDPSVLKGGKADRVKH